MAERLRRRQAVQRLKQGPDRAQVDPRGRAISPIPATISEFVRGLQHSAGNRSVGRLVQRWKDKSDRAWDYETIARPPADWKFVRDDKASGLVFEPTAETPDIVRTAFAGNKAMVTKLINGLKKGTITLADDPSVLAEAPKPLRPVGFPARTTAGVFLANPKDIRYSQDSISYSFSSGRDNVDSLAKKLKEGSVSASSIPELMLVEYTHPTTGVSHIITLDNRRLNAFRKAGVQVRCRWATAEEEKSNQWKFTAGDYGADTIKVLK